MPKYNSSSKLVSKVSIFTQHTKKTLRNVSALGLSTLNFFSLYLYKLLEIFVNGIQNVNNHNQLKILQHSAVKKMDAWLVRNRM